MKKLSKRIIAMLLIVSSIFSVFSVSACSSATEPNENIVLEKITTFHETVVSSQKCLDIIADDIYSNWYNAIYNDKYYGSIDLAIAYALEDNEENLNSIKANEPIIQSLYKEIRDSELEKEIKAVMSAYSDYYEFVVNVSGSFNSFSASKETLKKELASALKDLALEI